MKRKVGPARLKPLVDPERYRVRPGDRVRLATIPTDDDGGLEKAAAKAQFEQLAQRLGDLQKVMYAQSKHALLVIIQAMDGGGKDSTIRNVFTPVNPQGCKVVSFKSPNGVELAHDFLWRVHQNVPRLGHIGVHNRSHYEDVLIAAVKNLVPPARWKKRFDHINDFERLLGDEGTCVVKLFLHISKDYQKQRLERRLQRPDKQWKFNPEDLLERQRWEAYQRAYEVAMSRCVTEAAPWYIIPAQVRWFRDLLAMTVLVQTLESLRMKYPEPTYDPATIRIP